MKKLLYYSVLITVSLLHAGFQDLPQELINHVAYALIDSSPSDQIIKNLHNLGAVNRQMAKLLDDAPFIKQFAYKLACQCSFKFASDTFMRSKYTYTQNPEDPKDKEKIYYPIKEQFIDKLANKSFKDSIPAKSYKEILHALTRISSVAKEEYGKWQMLINDRYQPLNSFNIHVDHDPQKKIAVIFQDKQNVNVVRCREDGTEDSSFKKYVIKKSIPVNEISTHVIHILLEQHDDYIIESITVNLSNQYQYSFSLYSLDYDGEMSQRKKFLTMAKSVVNKKT